MSHGSTTLRSRDTRQVGARLLGTPVTDQIRARLLGDVDPALAWPGRYAQHSSHARPASREPEFAAWPEADILVSEIVSRTTAIAVPIIQFCSAGSARPGNIVHAFAAASARRLGRTLLLDAQPGTATQSSRGEASHIWQPAARSRAETIFPDCDANGLYHAQIPCLAGNEQEPEHTRLRALAECAGLRFRMLVVDCAAPASCMHTIALGGQCNGSILVVEAGYSRLADIQAAMRLLASGGATLFGTVLDNSGNRPLRDLHAIR